MHATNGDLLGFARTDQALVEGSNHRVVPHGHDGRHVDHCYFDNTDKVHAPANALRLLEMVNRPGNIAPAAPPPAESAAASHAAAREKARG